MTFITREEFRDALLTLYKELQERTKTDRYSSQRQEANKIPAGPPVTKLDFESSIETRTPETEKQTESKYHCRSLVVQWATFGVVFLYATIAAFQWCASREANKIANKSLQVQTRPWIGIVEIKLTHEQVVYDPNDPRQRLINWTLSTQVKNYGGSPARVFVSPIAPPKQAGKIWHTWKKYEVCETDRWSSFNEGLYTKIAFPGREELDMGSTGVTVNADGPKWLIICVAYQGLTDGKMHHAKFLYAAIASQHSVPVPEMPSLSYTPTEHFQLWDTGVAD
jgi:hypothetical protein